MRKPARKGPRNDCESRASPRKTARSLVRPDNRCEALLKVLINQRVPKLERLRGMYVVLSADDSAVITVGHHFNGRSQ